MRDGSGREEVGKAGTGLKENERVWVWIVNCEWGLEDVENGYNWRVEAVSPERRVWTVCFCTFSFARRWGSTAKCDDFAVGQALDVGIVVSLAIECLEMVVPIVRAVC